MFIQNKKINEALFDGRDSNGKKWEDYDTIVCPDGQVIDMQALIDEQQRAKAALTHIMPFFVGFINKLRHIYTFKVSTQATDGFNIYINPQFTANLDLTGKVFVMAHEIMHCVLNHLRRGKGHDPQQSNIAADYEVNSTIVELGLIKPATITGMGAYYDKKYADWGYEKIYDDVTGSSKNSMSNNNQASQAQQNQQSGDQGDGQGGSGQGDNNQQYSDEYKKGWNKAMEDYKAGKLKL